MQHPQHAIGGREVEVKAAVPKSRGGGQKPTCKLFVGGVPVRPPLLCVRWPSCAVFLAATPTGSCSKDGPKPAIGAALLDVTVS